MKYIYKLEHKRIVEIDDKTGEIIHSTILIGFFSSKGRCEEIILQYLEQPGFKDYPDDFIIKRITADVDDFNKIAGEFISSVFYLSHEYYDGVYDHISNLGYYSTKLLAEKAQIRYLIEPDFIEHSDGFCISEYEIGEGEWKEGFFTY
ncbi:hypothetical protein SDC9_109249 [bioreactor metagenome]|uniref:Uncharacterized protein n=1 Tax=bioreactor metagenome TaxID=1076179 RepID=A0A645BBE2_9ZZZZ